MTLPDGMEWIGRGPSPHLSWGELACKDGTPYPLEWRDTRAQALAEVFERVRAAAGGQPLRILSAYRTAEYNAQVPGAARNSQHVEGRAIDLAWPSDRWQDRQRLLAAAVAEGKRPGSALRGIGEYRWGVHLDIRPVARLVRWSGTKPVQVAREG